MGGEKAGALDVEITDIQIARSSSFIARGLSCEHRSFFQDFIHRCDRSLQLFIFIVEVRRHAHSGFGAIVDHDVALEQLAANLFGLGHGDGNGSAATLAVARANLLAIPGAPPFRTSEKFAASIFPEFDQCPTSAIIFSPGPRRFQRRDVRSAVHEAKRGSV